MVFPLTLLPPVLMITLYVKGRKNMAKGNANSQEWYPTLPFFLLFVFLSIMILLTTMVGIATFAITTEEEQPSWSYATLVANSIFVLLIVVADPILFSLDKDANEVIHKAQRSSERRLHKVPFVTPTILITEVK